MAKKPGAGNPGKSDFTTYFSSATQLPEPPVLERDRKRYDDLGIIGAQELSEKGFYASVVRGTPAAPARPAADTTILVVEDDAGTAQIVRRVLGAAGYKTRGAGNRAQIAKELGRTPQPDLILLDVVLAPGLSGFDILNKLRQHEGLKHIPVIMLTSMSRREHIVKGLGLGADAYLTKPARPSALVDAVRAVLDG